MSKHKTRWIIGPDYIDLVLELISFQPKAGTSARDRLMRQLQKELQEAVRECIAAHEGEDSEAEVVIRGPATATR